MMIKIEVKTDISQSDKTLNSRDVTTPDTLMDLIRQAVPPNIVQATMQQYRTALIKPQCKDDNCTGYVDDSNQWRDPGDPLTWKFKGKPTNTTFVRSIHSFRRVDRRLQYPRSHHLRYHPRSVSC